MRFICAESDGDGNRPRANSERKSQRIERISENVLQVDLFLDVITAIMVFLAFEHGPSIGDDDEAAADLHHGNGDTKEIQNVRADQKRGNQQDEAVHRHTTGKGSARGRRVFIRQGKKNRATTDWIHYRKKSTK